jgi:hypothetical protein
MNKQRGLLYKTLVVGVIILLICMNTFIVGGNPSNYNSGISLITIKVDGEIGLNNWYVSDVFFNFTYECDEIADIFYWIDGGPWLTYTEPFYLKDDGKDISIEWSAADHEGNYSEADGPFFCNIDQTKPDIALSYEVGPGNPYQGWEFTFTATAEDVMSGMERVEFYKNDVLQETVYGPGPEYSWSFMYFPEPSVSFSAMAYDNAGNSEWDSIPNCADINNLGLSYYKNNLYELKILNNGFDDRIVDYISNDNAVKSLPTGSEKNVFDPGYIIIVLNRKMGKEDWIVSNATISIYYESDRVDEVYYQINAGEWIQYFEPLVFSDGIYVFSWYIVDSEGYTSTPESIFFQIDRTCPEIILTKERLGIGKFKFSANVYDETSGIDRVKFKSSHGGSFTDYDFPFEWIWSPNDLVGWLYDWVTATVYDKAGNGNSCSMNTRSSSHSYIQQSSHQFTHLLIMRLFEGFPNMEVLLRIIKLLR